MEFIKIDNLSFSYPHKKNVLKNISFNIDKGDFVLLFGKSGSGKSTLLKHLSISLAPYGEKKGKIYYKGIESENISLKERCEKIGYVMQNIDAQIVTDKVWYELAFTLENLGYDNAKMHSRMAEITSFFSMSSWLDKDTSSLSGGEKQKLNLAVSMLTFPDVLLLDEPTSQLDPVMRDEFIRLLKRINKDYGTTIIITEHSFEGIIENVDKCVLLDNGRVVFNSDKLSLIDEIIEDKKQYYEFLPAVTKFGHEILNKNNILTVNEAKKNLIKSNINLKEKIGKIKHRSKESIIEVKNVSFKYSKLERNILKDVSLKIYKGDFLSIIGPNGVGKSTFLNLLIGSLKPNKGKIIKNGKIAMLPQNPVSLFIKSKVKDDLYDIDENYMELVDEFDVSSLIESHPYDLSGGEIELMALIKVLLVNPDIIILDEPTKGMDVIYKQKLGEFLNKLNEKGITIVIISHDLEFIGKYIPYCSIMFDMDIMPFKETREVFGESYFYTTDINRITKDNLNNIINLHEVFIDENKTV